MADILRIVTLSSGGRPVVAKELEDAVNGYGRVRDTFKFTPAVAQQQVSRSGRRYGGGSIVGETHDNAQISWTAVVKADTADQGATRIEQLLTQIASAARGRLMEWRPDGNSYSSFMVIVGPGSWDPNYQWVRWAGSRSIEVQITFPVLPLVEWAPLRIIDDFSVDSITDYTFTQGAGTLSVAGGQLVPSSTAAKEIFHTARGYLYEDVQITISYTLDAGDVTPNIRLQLRELDINNMITGGPNGTGSLVLRKEDGGVLTTLGTPPAIAAQTAGTRYWLRLRAQGNDLSLEHWTTEPTPMGTPAASVAFTLTGADATKFGAGVAGGFGVLWTPGSVNERIDDLIVDQYVFRNVTLPETLRLGGAIPGDAPAKMDVLVTPSGGAAAPVFALIGWTPRPGTPTSGVAPFGLLDSSTAGDLAGWASNATANARGGSDVRDLTVSGAEAYTASWIIDPHTLARDDFTEEIDLEVWARVIVGAGNVSPKFTLSARPSAGLTLGVERYTHEYGTAGKLATKPSTGDTYRFVRLGTLTFPVAPLIPSAWKLWLAASTAAGSTGQIGIDYLIVVPRRSRALSPTGVANDSATYPRFTNTTTEIQRRIRYDLSGLAATPPSNPYPQHGLGGALLQPPPGNLDMHVKLSSQVPDDPSSIAGDEQLAHAATVRADVTPRSYMLRS